MSAGFEGVKAGEGPTSLPLVAWDYANAAMQTLGASAWTSGALKSRLVRVENRGANSVFVRADGKNAATSNSAGSIRVPANGYDEFVVTSPNSTISIDGTSGDVVQVIPALEKR